jgi:2-polyprenyl-3-methyl-5-hydroxy-6-metoxy-1,4-benzoquinol methylase
MHPDPGVIFAELRAFERSAALKGAIDLELFTHIDDGSTTPREMAAKTGASERGIRILCDFLTIHGHLTKFGESYGLTMNSQLFLSKRSPSYLGSIADFLAGDQQHGAMWRVEAAVRKGGSVTDESLAPDSPMWAVFARGMAPLVRAFAGAAIPHVVSGNAPMKIMDIAAGHGVWGITALQLNPSAEVTGQDWPTVLEVAKENARQAGVMDRYHILPGSAFDVDFGTGWDLILEPNFAHHFDQATNVKMFKKIHAALNPGGRIAVLEFIPNEDRVSPPMAAAFALTMLTGTPAGDVYTFSEYSQMLEEAGFHDAKLTELAPMPQRLITAVA